MGDDSKGTVLTSCAERVAGSEFYSGSDRKSVGCFHEEEHQSNAPHIPAANWARPPTKQAMPMTALGTTTPRAWTLNMERIKVVLAKEKRPLLWKKLMSNLRLARDVVLTAGQGWR